MLLPFRVMEGAAAYPHGQHATGHQFMLYSLIHTISNQHDVHVFEQ